MRDSREEGVGWVKHPNERHTSPKLRNLKLEKIH